MAKKNQIKLKRLSEEVLETETKIVVLGDNATNGDAFAVAHVSFPKKDG